MNVTQAKEVVGLAGAANRELYKTLYTSIPAACNIAGFPIWKECMTQRQWSALVEAARALPPFAAVGPSVSTEKPKVQEACDVLVTYILSLYRKVPANIAGVANISKKKFSPHATHEVYEAYEVHEGMLQT